MRSDNICKYLASKYPQQFARWLFASDASDIELLPTELSRDLSLADTVILLQNANRILHLEFQTLAESTPPLPLRMLDYWVRLYRQYSRPIEQVVIFLKETTSNAAKTDRLIVGNTQHRYPCTSLVGARLYSLTENSGSFALCSSSPDRLDRNFTRADCSRDRYD